jgi:hypothetical protein
VRLGQLELLTDETDNLKQKAEKARIEMEAKYADFMNVLGSSPDVFIDQKIKLYKTLLSNITDPDYVNYVLDLSKPFDMPKKEYVITLEVGEHIPKINEDIFIGNVHNHNTKGVILSWAVVGQGGDGHVNCQNNDYIKQKFHDLGYKNDIEEEQFLRINSSFSWFKNTIMVFKK